MAGSNVGSFLSFFLVFYASQAYKRFNAMFVAATTCMGACFDLRLGIALGGPSDAPLTSAKVVHGQLTCVTRSHSTLAHANMEKAAASRLWRHVCQ